MLPFVWFVISVVSSLWCNYLFGYPIGFAVFTIWCIIAIPLAYWDIYHNV